MSDERVERVARELYAIDSDIAREMFRGRHIETWANTPHPHREVYRARALRILRVADEQTAPQGRYIVDGTTYLRASGDTLEEAVERWQKLANGGYPDGWEDTEEGEEGLIVGGCESCGRPILDGERYAVDDDLVYECSECVEPPVPDEAVGGLMEGIERTGGGA